MKNLLKIDLRNLLILVLGIIILLLYFTSNNKTKDGDKEKITIDGKKYEVIKKEIDTVYIDKIVEVPKYIPNNVTKLVEVPVIIPTDVDTLKILEKYYSSFKVVDTLKLNYNFNTNITDENGNKPNSDLGYGIITDIISQNKINSREIKWYYSIPVVYETKIVKELPKNQLYIGFNSNFDRVNLINSIGSGLILKTKTDKLYQLNLGLSNTSNGISTPYIGGGLYWKIKVK